VSGLSDARVAPPAVPSGLSARIEESAARLRESGFPSPRVAMILGTGLGRLGELIEPVAEIPYDEIPHFPRSTVESHAGKLIAGELAGRTVVAMQGRLHMYEGYTLQEVTFPVRVMRALGAEILVLSNAAGGLNPLFAAGDLMLIDDHINFMGDNPLRGPNEETLGPRFPDMSEAYDRGLAALAERVALAGGLRLQRGVYAALCGPALETRAEYRFLRAAGADAVGMSTVPETIVANHAGMRVLALSVITDMCLPDALHAVDIAQILRVAGEAEPRLARLVELVLRAIQ
jgi:purine-nucleoside phosphorylase